MIVAAAVYRIILRIEEKHGTIDSRTRDPEKRK